MLRNRGARKRRRGVTLVALALVASTLMVLIPAGSASAAFVQNGPRFLRSIGGSGRPGVFAWGVCYSEFSDEIFVTDYLNFQIRVYDKQGNHLRDFYRSDPDGQPYSCAVGADGSLFVAELKDNPYSNRIVKYDANGNHLYDFGPSGAGTQYSVWLTVDDLGNLWAIDSHYWNTIADPPQISKYVENAAGTSMARDPASEITVMPPDVLTDDDIPRLYGLDVISDGTIYVSDAWNRRVYRYAQPTPEFPTGQLLSTFGATQTGGDNRGVEVNEARDAVYVVDAENSDIDVFRMNGTYRFSFGSEGNGPGQFPGGGRQLAIDDEENVWVADFGGFEVEKYDWDGTPLLTAPNPSQDPPVGLLGQPRDVAVDDQTGEVWVADAWNQRFQRFSATGASMGSWGQRGPGGPFNMNYPRSIGINPANRQIWVSNERGHHIQVYNYPTSATASPTYVGQVGLIGSDDIDPGHFRWPVDIEFYQPPTGAMRVIIGDRMAASVKIFNAVTRQEITKAVDPDPSDPENPMIPVANHGTAVDPATGNIYVVNPNNDRIEVFDQAGVAVPNPVTGIAPFRFGSGGTQPGQFRDPVDAVISQGVLYVTDEGLSRVQAFDLNGTFLGRWGSTYGSNPYDFRGAIGIDAGANGNLYVTDAGNDRIQVFNPNLAKIADSTNPATPTITAPANQAVVGLGPVTITGVATDNSSVANVELSIQDQTTLKWWDAGSNAWVTTPNQPILAAWTSTAAPATSVNWRYVFHGVSANTEYLVQVKTKDANSGASQIVQRTFGMPGTGPVAPPPPLPVQDTTRPNGLLSFPIATPKQTLPFAPITFSGTATDNVGVTQVRISLKRLSNNTYWSGSASGSGFSSTFRYWDTTLDTPGGLSTGWTWAWTPRASTVPGDFQILVQAIDAAGNMDNSTPNVVFTVSNVPPDTIAPDTTLSAPTEGASFPTGPVSITGAATDNIGVGSTRLTITNGSGQFWNGTAFVATASTVNATLATPGAAATNWSYNFIAPTSGTFSVTAAAVDNSGAVDASPAGPVGFSTVGSADTTNPGQVVVTFPANNSNNPGSVTITGTAADNVGVTQVRVRIRLNPGTTWWNGTSFGAFAYVQATLDNPGGTSTGWSYTFTPPSTGNYGLQVFAVDAAGNVGANSTWRNFNIT